MDLESRSVNMQLNYDKFTMDTSVTLEKQFFQHSNFYVAAAFLCNLEEEAAFDRDLVFDKKSLLAPISAEDVYAVVKLCPYFVIAEGKIGIELLVRKSIVRQGFDCGGRLTVFLDRTEVTNKSKEGLLELNNTLLSKERFFELDVVKPDSDFVIAILDAIATNTDGLEKTSEKSYQMSENFVAKLLALGEAFSNLFILVDKQCDGFRCVQQMGTIKQKCHSCQTVLSCDTYRSYSAADKKCISRYKLCFECSKRRALKRPLSQTDFD